MGWHGRADVKREERRGDVGCWRSGGYARRLFLADADVEEGYLAFGAGDAF